MQDLPPAAGYLPGHDEDREENAQLLRLREVPAQQTGRQDEPEAKTPHLRPREVR